MIVECVRGTRQRKKKKRTLSGKPGPAQTVADVSPHTTFQREGLRLQLQGRGCQLLHLRNDHCQRARGASCCGGRRGVLPRAVRPMGQVKHSVFPRPTGGRNLHWCEPGLAYLKHVRRPRWRLGAGVFRTHHPGSLAEGVSVNVDVGASISPRSPVNVLIEHLMTELTDRIILLRTPDRFADGPGE